MAVLPLRRGAKKMSDAELREWRLQHDPGTIAAQLDSLRTSIAERRRQAQELAGEWLHAHTEEDARAIDARRVELLRRISRDEARLPELEERLAAAKAERQRDAIERHRKAARDAFHVLREALQAAAAAQRAAINARDAAIRELGGEGIVTREIPVIAFFGVVLPDAVEHWAAATVRAFDGPPPRPKDTRSPYPSPVDDLKEFGGVPPDYAPMPVHKPPEMTIGGPPPGGWPGQKILTVDAPATPPASVTEIDAMRPHAVRLDEPPPPRPPKPPRESRRDPAPAEGEVAVVFLRNGYELPNGARAVAGDRINLPAETATNVVRAGTADFATGAV